jgi:hypothetical protein
MQRGRLRRFVNFESPSGLFFLLVSGIYAVPALLLPHHLAILLLVSVFRTGEIVRGFCESALPSLLHPPG